jgi:hypothetical protein
MVYSDTRIFKAYMAQSKIGVAGAWWKWNGVGDRITHIIYSLRFPIRSRLGQRHGHYSITLTSLFCKNIYWKVIYVYSRESNFQDKSIYMIFTFSNSTTLKLFMIYIPNVWLEPFPKRLLIGNRREYIHTAHFGIHLDYHFRFQYFKLTYRYNVAMFVFKVQYEIIMFFRVKYIGGLQTYDAVLCRSTNL